MATTSQLSEKKSDFQQLHPSLKSYQASIDWFRYTEKCPICNQSLVIFSDDAYPCRVCGKAYHEKCMQLRKSTDSQAAKFLERAKTPVGWSCDQCSDIIHILSPMEQTKLMEMFERDDRDNDHQISLDEFLKAQDKTNHYLTASDPAQVASGKPQLNLSPEQVVKYKTYLFNLIDSDSSGYLDFQEYCTLHISMVLSERSPEDVIALLTPLERQRCKFIFDIIDTNSDGKITMGESFSCLKAWFDHMQLLYNAKKNHPERFTNNPIPGMICSDKQAKHVGLNIKIMMEITANRTKEVTFRDYLLDQAPAIIAQRPNKGNVTRGLLTTPNQLKTMISASGNTRATEDATEIRILTVEQEEMTISGPGHSIKYMNPEEKALHLARQPSDESSISNLEPQKMSINKVPTPRPSVNATHSKDGSEKTKSNTEVTGVATAAKRSSQATTSRMSRSNDKYVASHSPESGIKLTYDVSCTDLDDYFFYGTELTSDDIENMENGPSASVRKKLSGTSGKQSGSKTSKTDNKATGKSSGKL